MVARPFVYLVLINVCKVTVYWILVSGGRQLYFMSGTGAVHKGTSLHKLLDQFVDAQRRDIKA